MKTVFFTGKGGVGKSTLSAAAAWQLAKRGYKVLAVSFDPAHNLGDIFETNLSYKKKKFTKNLYLQETNLEKAADEYVKTNIDLMKEIYGYLKTFNMDKYFGILKYSPGIEEYAALTALEKILVNDKDTFDYIIFDTPPTGLTLHIFALPSVTLAWLERLIKIRQEILSKRYVIHNIQGKYAPEGVALVYDEKDDRVIQKLYELQRRYAGVEAFLQGDNNTVTVVFNPDFLSLKESERLMAGLNELKLPVQRCFNNKVTTENSEIGKSVEKALRRNHPSITIQQVPYASERMHEGYKLSENIADAFL